MTLTSHTHPTPRRAVLRLGPAVVDLLLWTYRVTLSPLLGPSCRFAPSCSQYTREAVARYGVTRGSWLGLKRVLRCHPFHPGGWDPVV